LLQLRDSHARFDAKVPMAARVASGVPYIHVIDDNNEGVLVDILVPADNEVTVYPRAGPRSSLFFRPSHVNAGIVTCGGLCPGLNSVIRDVTKSCFELYGVQSVIGFHGGFSGIFSMPFERLTLESTQGIQNLGGTILSSARGGFDADRILNKLEDLRISQLFIVGGDGSMRGARELVVAITKRPWPVAIIGIPKTIDNDIGLIDHSFGFQTAVEETLRAVRAAKVEAACSINGVGVVQCMGRHAGYIAAQVTLASAEVDLCIIPEVPIAIDGSLDVLEHVIRVVEKKGHAVVVVAEGAGENLLGKSEEFDASGNRRLRPIGPWIKEAIAERLTMRGLGRQVRLIDPSYMVRSVAAYSVDSILCTLLSLAAVHAAMDGYTGVCVALVNGRSVMVPLDLIVEASPRKVDVCSRTYERIVSLTSQPFDFTMCPRPAGRQTSM